MTTASTLPAPAVNAARMTNYLLGGHDNWTADRDLAEALDREAARVLGVRHPVLAPLNKQNRRFIERAVRELADSGIRQFLDLGCGLPVHRDGAREPMVHELANVAGIEPRVVYVDHDAFVFGHMAAAVTGEKNVRIINADLADPESALIGEAIQEMAGGPVAVLLASVLHYWPPAKARSIVAHYADQLPPRTAVVVSAAHFECDAAMDERRRLVPSLPFFNHSAGDIESFFTCAGLKLDGPAGDVAPMSLAGEQKVAVMLGAVGVKP